MQVLQGKYMLSDFYFHIKLIEYRTINFEQEYMAMYRVYQNYYSSKQIINMFWNWVVKYQTR